MSYDAGEYDDDRARDAGRRSGGARPAWDAATYGTPEDLRRSRPRRGSEPRGDRGPNRSQRGADPYAEPSPYGAPDTYPAADPYSAPDPYSEPDPYSAPDPYPAPDAYRAAEPYPTAEPYTAPAEPYGYPAAEQPSDPYRMAEFPKAESYRSDPYAYPAAPDSYAGDESFAVDEPVLYPGGLPDDDPPPEAPPSRAGRNLPAAIGVGVGLGAAVLASLFLWRPAFLGVIAVAVGIGVWELVRAIRSSGANPPIIPLITGGVLMAGLAWWGQADALTFGLFVTVLAVMIWRLGDGAGEYGRDVTAATLVAVYVPFLAGFAALLASPADGAQRIVAALAGVVLSDTGGYIAGVLFGRHPMAPSVSPKKSWEGLAGSLVAAGVGGAVLLGLMFHVSPVWGALFGLAIAAASTLGDLAESLIKRDLGVKDMSNLLPGHGGLMDRLDSIVFAAPTAYVLFAVLAPPG